MTALGNVASTLTTTKIDGLTKISLASGNTTFALNNEDFGGELKKWLEIRDVTLPEFQNDIDRMVKADSVFFVKDAAGIPCAYKSYLFEKRWRERFGVNNWIRIMAVMNKIMY